MALIYTIIRVIAAILGVISLTAFGYLLGNNIFKPVKSSVIDNKELSYWAIQEKRQNKLKNIRKRIAPIKSRDFRLKYIQEEWEAKIDSIDYSLTFDEVLFSQYKILAIGIALSAVLSLIAPLLTIMGGAVTIFISGAEFRKIDKQLNKVRRQIEEEFPKFYSAVYSQYTRTNDTLVSNALKVYYNRASPLFKKEINRVIEHIQIVGELQALHAWKDRIKVAYVSIFADRLDARLNGRKDGLILMTNFKRDLELIQDQKNNRILKESIERAYLMQYLFMLDIVLLAVMIIMLAIKGLF